MPEVKLPDAAFTGDAVICAVALIVAGAGVLVALVKGWEAWKKISVRDKVKSLERRMTKVEARLSLGDKRFELQNDDMGAMLATQQALLLHFISGNDHDKLRTELTNLSNYMNQRATRVIEYAAEHEEMQNGGTDE